MYGPVLKGQDIPFVLLQQSLPYACFFVRFSLPDAPQWPFMQLPPSSSPDHVGGRVHPQVIRQPGPRGPPQLSELT